MTTSVRNAVRPFIRALNRAIVICLMVSGCAFFLLLPILLVVWIVIYNGGTKVPDATHLVRLSDHGHSRYILHSRRAIIDVVQILLCGSGLLLFLALLALKVFNWCFPPDVWDYKPQALT